MITQEEYFKAMKRIIYFTSILETAKRLTKAQIAGYEKSIKEANEIKKEYEKASRS